MGTKKATIALWTVQGLLAALFLFAGGMKLVMPVEEMTRQIGFPGWFIRFIGVCEVLGALGLVLPTALRILPILTPVAAAGLVIIMAGATTITIAGPAAAQAVVPMVVGSLCAAVLYGRRPHAAH
jgi:uncharacterized membrane protein YphA (DoxX/SURF4 family)